MNLVKTPQNRITATNKAISLLREFMSAVAAIAPLLTAKVDGSLNKKSKELADEITHKIRAEKSVQWSIIKLNGAYVDFEIKVQYTYATDSNGYSNTGYFTAYARYEIANQIWHEHNNTLPELAEIEKAIERAKNLSATIAKLNSELSQIQRENGLDKFNRFEN